MNSNEILLICPFHHTERIEFICTNTACGNRLACKVCCASPAHLSHQDKLRLLNDFLDHPKPIISLPPEQLAFLDSFGVFKQNLDCNYQESDRRLRETLDKWFTCLLAKANEFQEEVLASYKNGFKPFVANIEKIESVIGQINSSFSMVFQRNQVPGGPALSSSLEAELNNLITEHNDPLVLLELDNALKNVISHKLPVVEWTHFQTLLEAMNQEMDMAKLKILPSLAEASAPAIGGNDRNSLRFNRPNQEPPSFNAGPPNLIQSTNLPLPINRVQENRKNSRLFHAYKDSSCQLLKELGNFLFTLNQERTVINVINIETGQLIWNFKARARFDDFEIDRSEFELFMIDGSDRLSVACLKNGEAKLNKALKYKIDGLIVLNDSEIVVLRKGNPKSLEIWQKANLESAATVHSFRGENAALCRLSDSFFACTYGKKLTVFSGASAQYEKFKEITLIFNVNAVSVLVPLHTFGVLTESNLSVFSFPEIEIKYKLPIPGDFYTSCLCGGITGVESSVALVKKDSIAFFFPDGQRERCDKIDSAQALNGVFVNQSNKFFFALNDGDVLFQEFTFK